MNSLQIINKVLLELGERTVTTVQENSASRKAYGMLQEVVDAVNFEHTWEELHKEVLLSTLDEVADSSFPAAYCVAIPQTWHSVERVVDTDGDVIQYVQYRKFNTVDSEIWTTKSNKLLYSGDTVATNILVHYYASFIIDEDEEEQFTVSLYLQNLYAKRLLLQFTSRHLNNFPLVDAVYEEYAAALATRDVKTKLLPSSRNSEKHSHGEANANFSAKGSSN